MWSPSCGCSANRSVYTPGFIGRPRVSVIGCANVTAPTRAPSAHVGPRRARRRRGVERQTLHPPELEPVLAAHHDVARAAGARGWVRRAPPGRPPSPSWPPGPVRHAAWARTGSTRQTRASRVSTAAHAARRRSAGSAARACAHLPSCRSRAPSERERAHEAGALVRVAPLRAERRCPRSCSRR